MKTITLRLEYDQDSSNPLEDCDGMWRLVEGRDVEDFFTDRGGATTYKFLPDTLALFWKLRNGLAWIVDGMTDGYGYCSYDVTDYDPTDRIERFLIWEHPAGEMGAKTKEERKKDAAACLGEYRKWITGEVFGYIKNANQANEDSCWGFIGQEYFHEMLRDETLPDERPLRVVLHGKHTAEILGDFSFGEGVEVMTWKEHEAWQQEQDDIEDGSEWANVV